MRRPHLRTVEAAGLELLCREAGLTSEETVLVYLRSRREGKRRQQAALPGADLAALDRSIREKIARYQASLTADLPTSEVEEVWREQRKVPRHR